MTDPAPASLTQGAAGELEAQVLLARRFPRDLVTVTDAITADCGNFAIAESALYSFPRGREKITGASIRLAELLARHYGNVTYGSRQLSPDKSPAASTRVECYCWDLQNNVKASRVYDIAHLRATSQGNRVVASTRDVTELVLSQASRLLRGVILSVIPSQLTTLALDHVKTTLAQGDAADGQVIGKLTAAFAQFGVSPADLERALKFPLDQLHSAQIAWLRGVYQSLRDGLTTPADWFNTANPDPDPALKNPLQAFVMRSNSRRAG